MYLVVAVSFQLKLAIEESGNGLYIASGALWGGEDIRKMADIGLLKVSKKLPCQFVNNV